MAGLIMGALGGGGQAAMRIGENMQRGAIEEDLIRVRSQVDKDRTIALEKARLQMGDQQRQQTLDRRQTAKTGIINSALAERYAEPVMGDAPLTPDQQAAMDEGLALQAEEKSRDRKAMENDYNVDVRAAVQTGEISPKDAASLGQRDAANETRLAIAQLRTEALNAKTQAQLDLGMAKLEAAVAKAGAGNTDFDKKITLLKKGGLNEREIANFILERKQPSLEDLAANFLKADPRAGTSKAMTPEQAMERAKALRSLTRDLGEDEDAGAPPAEPSKPAAKPAAKSAAETTAPKSGDTPPGLPAGSKKIGTSGGKDVYQAPDGKRYIAQ
jgi:hypothetical protein